MCAGKRPRDDFIYDVPPRSAQRLDDPLHWTPAQELVSIDAEFTRRTCEDTHENARRRRRVARIERGPTLLHGQASQPSPADHYGSIGSLPNVDAELPENGKVVFDVLGLGKIADRARAVGQGRREGGALGDRLVARRAPNDLSRTRHIEAYGDRNLLPAPCTRRRPRTDLHVMRHAIDDFGVAQQLLGLRVVDRRGRNPVGHRLGERCVAEPLALKPKIVFGNERSST